MKNIVMIAALFGLITLSGCHLRPCNCNCNCNCDRNGNCRQNFNRDFDRNHNQFQRGCNFQQHCGRSDCNVCRANGWALDRGINFRSRR